ncbi:MAG: ATP-grasp domain-containing protein, partial [Gammaproteobacteria bacterium]
MIEYVLIVARSGRMLAEAARAIGLKPLVVDCYGDIDTRTFAESVIQVDALDVDSLEAAAVAFKNRFPVEYALYGSGLETVPECIDRLAAHFRVLGNAYRTLLSVQNKALFFETLSKFKIPHPEVSMIEPSTREGWLVKPPRGEGGIGIYRFGTKAPVACSDV